MCAMENTSTLVLALTRKCQLNCRYCEMSNDKKDLTEEGLYRAIDFLFTSKKRKLELHFFGGEPLLRFDLIEKGIIYAEGLARESNKKIRYLITTNGISLSEKKLKTLSPYNVCMMFSIDGIKKTNTLNRMDYKNDPSLYKKIINNIILTKKHGFSFFVNMTVSPINVNTMIEDFKYLSNLGIKNFQLVYSLGVYWSDAKKEQFISKLEKIQSYSKNIGIKYPLQISNEPTLVSPVVIVDVDEKIYVGCSLVLENKFPNLHNEHYEGNLNEISNINSLRRTHLEQMVKILLSDKLTERERKIVNNNIEFGISLLENSGRKDNFLLLELQLTSQCQLNCLYCELERNNPDMSREVLYKGIFLAFQSEKNHIKIQFFGGEPLLRFDLVREGVDYAKELAKKTNKKVEFCISTNGLLLDKEKIDFIKDHKFHIIYSLDGGREIHLKNGLLEGGNKNFQENFSLILNNYEKIKEENIEHFVNLVVNGKNIYYLKENIEFLLSRLNAKNILISPMIGYYWRIEEQKRYFGILREVLKEQSKNVNFLNIKNPDEPAIASTSINIDFDGSLYFGCTLSMRKTFPSFKNLNYIGNIENTNELPAKLNYMRQIINLINSNEMESEEKRLVINNLLFGIKNRVFFDMLRKSKTHQIP